MKNILKPKNLPVAVGGLGVIGMLLRFLVNWIALDQRGQIIANHPLVMMLWLVTAAAVVLTVTMVWNLDGGRKYAPNFPASKAAAGGCGLMALCTMVTVALSWERSGLGLWRYALGVAAGSCLIFLAFARFRGVKPAFFFHTVVCAFFAIHMISRYRPWSGDPQLMDYLFEVFACIGLMLFAYYQASFEVGMGKRRMQLGIGLLTAYCCLTALPGSLFPLLYAGGAVWTLTNLCNLTPPPRRKKVAPEAPRQKANETA